MPDTLSNMNYHSIYYQTPVVRVKGKRRLASLRAHEREVLEKHEANGQKASRMRDHPEKYKTHGWPRRIEKMEERVWEGTQRALLTLEHLDHGLMFEGRSCLSR